MARVNSYPNKTPANADILYTDAVAGDASGATFTVSDLLAFMQGNLNFPPGVTDHAALTGLAVDDHTQYHTDARGDARYSPTGHNHSHGTLTDLTVDDHSQYHTDARGDARYLSLNGGTVTGPVIFEQDIDAFEIYLDGFEVVTTSDSTVFNIVSSTQIDYDNLTPDPGTLYLIIGP